MDRKEIENKDQELLKDIREIVRRNEEKSPKNNSLFQSMKFWLTAVIVVVLVGIVIFNKLSTPDKADDSLQASAEAVDRETVDAHEKPLDLKITYEIEDSAPLEASTTEQESSGEVERASAEAVSSSQGESEASTTGAVESNVSPAIEMPQTEKKPESSVEMATSSEPLKTEDSEADESTETEFEQAASAGWDASIRIAKLVSCAGVQDRQYVSPQSVFSMKKVSNPVVWMTVLTDKPPFTLTHVYYHNEKKYVEVPLEVKYPRMRTWSRLTLRYPYQTGQYRVEVITDAGEVLGEIEYTVVP